jgi:hypothetical protein
MDDWIEFFSRSHGQKNPACLAAFINLNIDPTDAMDA